MHVRILIGCLLSTTFGCTVYKSSDRDSFNANAAKNSSSQSLRADLLPAGAVACDLSQNPDSFGAKSAEALRELDALAIRVVTTTESNGALRCSFKFSSSADESTSLEFARAQVERLASEL